MDGLKWVMELMDRTSGPARRVVQSLNAVRAAQDNVRAAAARAARTPDPTAALERVVGQRRSQRRQRLGRELEEFAESQRETTVAGSSMGAGIAAALMHIGAAAVSAAAAVARIGFALGRSAAEAADWRNRTVGAFEVLGRGSGGGANRAREMFDVGSRYAQRFGLDVRDVQSSLVGLTAAGMNRDRALQIMQAAGDLGALSGGQSGERAIAAFRQIQSKGVLQMEELQQQLSEAGLNVGDVTAEIGQMRGLRGSATSVSSRVRTLITNSRVSSSEGIDAALRVIARRSGGRLGGTLDSQAHGVSSALTRLNNSWLLLQSTFAQTAAFRRIVSLIERLAAALDPTTETGAQLADMMNRVFDEVTSVFDISDKNTKGGLVAVFHDALQAVDSVIGAIRVLFAWGQAFYGSAFETFGESLNLWKQLMGDIFGEFDAEGPDVLEFLKALGKLGGWIATVYLTLYTLIGGAIYIMLFPMIQMYEGFRDLFKLIEDGWNALPEPVRDALTGMATVFFGGEIDQSLFADATNVVNQGRDPSVGRPVVSQPNVTVNVNAMAAAGATPEEIAAAAAAGVPPAVQGAADRASRRAGA